MTESLAALPMAARLDTQVLSAARTELLALRGIHKRWGKRPILTDLDLVVEPGTILLITGPNGIGKTTLLRIGAGLIQPERGEIDLDGLHPERNRRDYLSRIGFLSAGDRGLYARLNARRHLDFCARLFLKRGNERNAAIERAIEMFQLSSFADRRVDRISMGQRQRTRLAMTFVHEPALLLLDEPANSLDEEGLGVLTDYLEGHRRRGGAAIWCSPAGLQVPLEFDRHYLLEDGRLRPQ